MSFRWTLPTVVAFCLGALALAGCGKNSEAAKQEYLATGDKLAAEEKYAEAIVQYRRALQIDDKYGDARYKLAEAYLKSGSPVSALPEYMRASDLMPDNADAQMKASAMLLVTGQFEDAKTRALRIVAKEPANTRALILLGNALAGMKDYDGAIKQLEQAVQLEPNAAGYATLANVELARGRQPDAEAAFRRAIAADPNSIDAQLSLAQYLWGAGRKDESEQVFRKAIEIDPANAMANRSLAVFMLHSNRAAEAEPFLKGAANADRTPQAPQKLALAEYYMAFNRADDAVKVLEPLTKVKESQSAAETRLAAIQYARKQTTEAHKTIDGVLSREPKNVPALLVKARFLAEEKKLDDALKQTSAATQAEPDNAEAHYTAGRLYMAHNEPSKAIASFDEVLRLNPKAVTTQVYLSRLHLLQGDTNLALSMAETAAQQLPAEPTVQLTLARSLIAKRELQRADPIVKQLVAKYGNTSVVQSTSGALSAAKKDWAAAGASYERALQLDESNLEALNGLVGVDLALKRTDAARSRVDRLVAQTPNSAPLLMLSAQVDMSANDLPKAEATLRKAVAADPNSLKAYSLLGQVLVMQRKAAQAREQYEQMAAKNPRDVAAQTMVGMLYEAENNRAEARKRYEQIVNTDPRAAIAANNLAWIYADSDGNLDIALQLAQSAKSQLPDMPEINDTLGWIYYKKNLPALAIPPLEQAVEKDPKNPGYLVHLGLSYAKTGNKEKARTSLNEALRLDPNLPEAGEAKRALGAM